MMIEIKMDEELKMYVLAVDGKPMMKNKKQSVLLKKYSRFLQSQGE